MNKKLKLRTNKIIKKYLLTRLTFNVYTEALKGNNV